MRDNRSRRTINNTTPSGNHLGIGVSIVPETESFGVFFAVVSSLMGSKGLAFAGWPFLFSEDA